MEECIIGRMQDWKGEGLEGSRIGIVQDWKSVGLEGFKTGRAGKMGDGIGNHFNHRKTTSTTTSMYLLFYGNAVISSRSHFLSK